VGEEVLCVDFGSTFTKAALVDVGSGTLVGTTSHRTTIDTDILDGYDACLGALRADHPEVDGAKVLACSSAGGGLRVAVVGNEELVTAEAGRRVALSSGGKVVHVVALAAEADPLPGLLASKPDVVLLVGGTDGGNTEALLAGARMLAGARWVTPVVVAGNVDAREDVAGLLAGRDDREGDAAALGPADVGLHADTVGAHVRDGGVGADLKLHLRGDLRDRVGVGRVRPGPQHRPGHRQPGFRSGLDSQ